MKKSLKAAVIGAGKMGSFHANILKSLPGVKLCALVTKTPTSARIKEKEYKIPVYTSLLKLFSKHELDFVVISSPTIYHKTHAIKALENNCHVLIEKPIAVSTAEAEDIIEVEKRVNKKVMIGHIERFNPLIKRAKKLIEKKVLGSIILYEAERSGTMPKSPKTDVLIDRGIHDFDLFNFLIHERLGKIDCLMQRKLNRKYDDFAQVRGESVNGTIFNYQTDWLRKDESRETIIIGDKGELKINFMNNKLSIFNDKNPEGKVMEVDKEVNKLEEEIKAFIKCILKDIKVPISTKEGLSALEIYEACIR